MEKKIEGCLRGAKEDFEKVRDISKRILEGQNYAPFLSDLKCDFLEPIEQALLKTKSYPAVILFDYSGDDSTKEFESLLSDLSQEVPELEFAVRIILMADHELCGYNFAGEDEEEYEEGDDDVPSFVFCSKGETWNGFDNDNIREYENVDWIPKAWKEDKRLPKYSFKIEGILRGEKKDFEKARENVLNMYRTWARNHGYVERVFLKPIEKLLNNADTEYPAVISFQSRDVYDWFDYSREMSYGPEFVIFEYISSIIEDNLDLEFAARGYMDENDVDEAQTFFMCYPKGENLPEFQDGWDYVDKLKMDIQDYKDLTWIPQAWKE